MKKEMLKVVVTSNGAVIGSMLPREFKAYANKEGFLDTLVSEFNAHKAEIGEPERVHVELNK